MIEKLTRPIRFDKDVDVLVVARDGEKFYVSDSEASLDLPLTEMKPRPLLEWAMISNYPIRKFVRAQRVLSAKFFGA
jgi:hypothetical protein